VLEGIPGYVGCGVRSIVMSGLSCNQAYESCCRCFFGSNMTRNNVHFKLVSRDVQDKLCKVLTLTYICSYYPHARS
jgi:hypothetical protein